MNSHSTDTLIEYSVQLKSENKYIKSRALHETNKEVYIVVIIFGKFEIASD